MQKKIGILTFHWSDNYGAVLQAYALQSFIQSYGYKCEIIDYLPPRKNILHRLISRSIKKQIEKLSLYIKHLKFETFRNNFLSLSVNSFFSSNALNKSLQSEYFCVIVGSDQVWNPTFKSATKDFFKVYMLDFPGSIKKISYAPSIGHSSKVTIDTSEQLEICNLVSGFNHISVREKSSISLLKSIGVQKPIMHVCDPTILLDVDKYPLDCARKTIDPYIFSYILHGADKEFEKLNVSLANKLNLRIVCCNSKTIYKKSYVLPSPTNWLYIVKKSSFLTTNSFHGVVFAIKYKVPFIVLKRSDSRKSMNTRLDSLLSVVGLSDRFLSFDEINDCDFINEPIDWENVHDKLDGFQKTSSSFLINAISGKY